MRALVWLALLTSCGARSPIEVSSSDASAGDDATRPDAAPITGCTDGPGRWIAHPSPTTASLHDVHVVSRDDAWIVGDEGIVLHWDGSDWRLVVSGTTDTLTAVWADARDGWIVGAHALLRRDGERWLHLPLPALPGVAVLSSLWARSRDDAWIGGGIASPQVGLLFHHDGSAIAPVEVEPTGIQVVDLEGTEDGTIWLVAHLGRVARIAADGSIERIEEPGGDGTITSVLALGPDEALFPALHGYVHQLRGVAWTSTRIGEPDHQYYAAWGPSAAHVWVAGWEGAAAHFDGTTWTLSSLPTSSAIFAIDGSCATDAWAVGEDGTILRLVP